MPTARSSLPNALAGAVIFLLLTALAGPARAQFGGGPAVVGTVTVQRRPVTESNEFVGRIQAVSRVDLVARVTAFLEKRLFVEGSEVAAGDLLYQLERGPFEADVNARAAAEAQAEALLRNAGLTLGRAQSLLNTPAGQRSTFDDATAQRDSQAAQVAAARAQLRAAQINFDYTLIKAPVAGQISRTNVTEGNVVSPTSGVLATIVSQDPMYVLFPVSVRTALDLRNRDAEKGGLQAVTVKVRLPNGKLYGQTGRLDYIDPTVATNTDTLTFRAVMPNPKRPRANPDDVGTRELVDGEFVTAIIEAVQPIEALAIPRAAVLQDQQGSYVFVVGDGTKAEQRRITLGQSTPDTAVVMTGLKEGEQVIADGIQRVRPGAVVAPAPMAPGPVAPAATPPGGTAATPPGGTAPSTKPAGQ